jgi:hypothetical protein
MTPDFSKFQDTSATKHARLPLSIPWPINKGFPEAFAHQIPPYIEWYCNPADGNNIVLEGCFCFRCAPQLWKSCLTPAVPEARAQGNAHPAAETFSRLLAHLERLERGELKDWEYNLVKYVQVQMGVTYKKLCDGVTYPGSFDIQSLANALSQLVFDGLVNGVKTGWMPETHP